MLSRIAGIFKTFTFRLALVYVGLFGLSVVVLFGFIYSYAMNYLEEQITDSIRTQYNYLIDEYRVNGTSGVEVRIKEMMATDDDGTSIYMFINQKSEKLAGNMVEWPQDAQAQSAFEKDGQWVKFYIDDAHGSPQGIEVRAIIKPLSKWRTLLIGQTLQPVTQMEYLIARTFWASLFLTVAIAFAGAMVMTRSVITRLSVINRSASSIMHGNLSVRIPFVQGGDEFDELSVNLNRMLDRIESLLKSLSEFSTNIAHDLRSPLNRVINRMEAGLRSADPSNPDYQRMENNIHDLQGLVATFNSILKISELEANTEFRPFESCDLCKIVANLVEFYEPYAAAKNIHLRSQAAGQAMVYGEKNLLAQAFVNLLDNAIKFTPEGGQIEINCDVFERFAEITVADSGTGIPEEFREKVFEKFFRMEQSRNTKGNGLGLSLVAAVARIHGAIVTLEDNHPGLKVIFRIPLSAN